jgi:5-dehydro-2-deoxygluconokinase
MPSRTELTEYMKRAHELPRPDFDELISHIHHATTVRRSREELYVLAFDHRRQLEELADEHGLARGRIADFKDLIAQAVEEVAERLGERERVGVIVDSRHGQRVLSRLGAQGFWIGRPIETPGSRPVAFDATENIGLHLTRWPVDQVIKCLVFYHPDEPVELRLSQEQRVRELYQAAQALDRDLLLEIISSARGLPVDDETTARTMQRIYNLGVRPAWWKLEPPTKAAWRNISDVIKARDPWCNGVLLLGLDAPEDVLQRAFETAADVPLCKGFAVGRSIFNPAAREWFAGRMSDADATADVAARYERLIEMWRALRAQQASPPVRTASVVSA